MALRLLYNNYLLGQHATITATSEASGLPASAAADPQRTRVWRSLTETGTQALDIDLGVTSNVTCVALANVQLIAGTGSVTLQQRGTGASPGAAVNVATLPWQDPDTRVAMSFFSLQNFRHWRLLWSNDLSANAYAEVGYVFLGAYWEAPVNFSVPSENGFSDLSIPSTSLDGQKDFVTRTGVHTASLRFDAITEQQRSDLRAIYRLVGVRMPIFTALDPSLSWTHWLARFASPISHSFDIAPGRYSLDVSLEEVR